MNINIEKLNDYLNTEKIITFTSEENLLMWFVENTDLHFTSIDEVIASQGKNVFRIGKQIYYIKYESALDVWQKDSLADFSADELSILSEGMLELINVSDNATRLLRDTDSINSIKKAINKYNKLNQKICQLMDL